MIDYSFFAENLLTNAMRRNEVDTTCNARFFPLAMNLITPMNTHETDPTVYIRIHFIRNFALLYSIYSSLFGMLSKTIFW